MKCIQCKFAGVDSHASTKKWKAIECKNPDSEFYKFLLNVDYDGNEQKRITWIGCKEAREKEGSV